VYGQLRQVRSEPVVAAPEAPPESHIEAQLRYKIDEKDAEIARLNKKVKAALIAEKKGLVQAASIDAERGRHQDELNELRDLSTRMETKAYNYELRAIDAENQLERAERIEKRLVESQSRMSLANATTAASSFASLPPARPRSSSLNRPVSATTGRELPARDAIGARSTLRVGELLNSRPQSAHR